MLTPPEAETEAANGNATPKAAPNNKEPGATLDAAGNDAQTVPRPGLVGVGAAPHR